MSDGTDVRCLDCGHEWNTVADYPQCSDPNDECGRSRNVESVNKSEAGEQTDTSPSERDASPSGDSQSEGEWSPLFDAQDTETEAVEDMSISEAPEIDDYGAGESDPEADPDAPEMSAEPDLPDLEPEDIELFVKTPFDMAAKSRGDHWELGDDELDQLSHAYCRVGNKYAPYMLAEHAPEAMAVITTVAVVGPRVAEDKKKADKAEKEAKDTDAREQSDRNSGQEVNETESDGFAYEAL